MNLKSMSVDRLRSLRDRVEMALKGKVTDQRRAIESQLATLSRFQGGKGLLKLGPGRGIRGPVAPKYRNPENPAETWAGRGLKPKWLTVAIKAGKKPHDFLIAGSTASSKANGRKKAREVR